DDDKKITVLATSIGMAKGLTIARLFHRTGYRVIGADTKMLSPGAVSTAVHRYYRLPNPSDTEPPGGTRNKQYVSTLLDIVQAENVNLWISVSDVHSPLQDAIAKEKIEAQTSAKAIQSGVEETRTLHDKGSFMELCKRLGLSVPDHWVAQTQEEAATFVNKAPQGRQYLAKPTGVDNPARFDSSRPLLLPQPTEAETASAISRLHFEQDNKSSLLLQEFIPGGEFCTHALVIQGRVRAFVACPSNDLLMHYTALHHESQLSQKMLAFTTRVAEHFGDGFSGHLSFDFMAATRRSEDEDNAPIYAIECNPRVHTAVVLFSQMPGLVGEYLSLTTAPDADPTGNPPPLRPDLSSHQHYYWIGQDLFEHVYPIVCRLWGGNFSLRQCRSLAGGFFHHVLSWKDGTFEAWDPLPWWWVYRVFWPAQFVWLTISGQRWSRMNVSAGRVYEA
ncbi:hypothetical protein B0H63DRAFT_399952, partial [Podospora didyma]